MTLIEMNMGRGLKFLVDGDSTHINIEDQTIDILPTTVDLQKISLTSPFLGGGQV